MGRRRPVLAGAALFAAASLACAVAPSVETLVGLRFLQGLGGAAGIVVGRAIVRDLYEGDAAARLYSSLMLVGGIAPILAPVIGGLLLAVTDWRGVFVVLSACGAALLAAAARGLPESLGDPLEPPRRGPYRPARPAVRRLRALQRPDDGRDVRLHRRLTLRAADDLRAEPAGLLDRVRRQRARHPRRLLREPSAGRADDPGATAERGRGAGGGRRRPAPRGARRGRAGRGRPRGAGAGRLEHRARQPQRDDARARRSSLRSPERHRPCSAPLSS